MDEAAGKISSNPHNFTNIMQQRNNLLNQQQAIESQRNNEQQSAVKKGLNNMTNLAASLY